MASHRIVVLDGYALNPGDISWSPVEDHGELTVFQRSGALAAERAKFADIVLTNKDPINATLIEQLRELKYIGVLATGTNIVDLNAASERGIVVTNVPGYGAAAVAQHVFAILLDLVNHTSRHAQAVREGKWQSCPDFCFTVDTITELADKNLGIVGLGAIGRRVATIGNAFGMRVFAAHQRSMNEVGIDDIHIQWTPVDELFEQGDVVALHCPLTDETHQLVNRKRLSRMKKRHILLTPVEVAWWMKSRCAKHLKKAESPAPDWTWSARNPPPRAIH